MKSKNVMILIFLLLFILTLGAVSASSDNSTDVVAADDDNDLEMQSDSGQILASNEDDDVVCDVGNGTVLSKTSSSLSFEPLSDVYAGDDVAVTVLLTPSDVTGNVELSVDGNTMVSSIVDGNVSFRLSGLTVGSHNLVASYSGDSNYERSNASATLNVIDDKSFEALQALINGAVDSLVLTKDYYGNGQEITITNTISIDGGGHTIDAKGLSRIFNIQADDVVLKNFNFINGFSDEDGGAIYWSGSNGLINSSTFVNSTANNSGAIYISVNADNGLIKSVSFINNTATVSGGAIRNQRGNNWTIEDSIFINNSAHGETNIIDAGGGAIWSCNSVMYIMNSIFKENNAPFGGALRGSFYISDSEFDSNTATDGNGGAIDVAADASFSYDLHLVFENLTFTNNIAKGDSSDLYDNERAQGGAIHLYDIQRVDMLNCACINNTADRGGAIDGYMMNVTYVDNCIFENNTALNYGGAVSMDSCIVSNCYFSNNIATGGDSQGGALYFNSKGNVTNCNFAGNTADYGGALYFNSKGNVTNCNFAGNTADYGGAINIYSGSVTNCSFTNNSATDGGAIFRDSGSVENCYFTGNTATDNGGAVYFESTGNVTNCDFAGNTATDKGGAIRMYSGSVENCNFTNNSVSHNGGAVYFNSNSNVINCNFVDNKATADYSEGGAICGPGTVSNCNFTNNTAFGDGGAVSISSGDVSNCNFTGNTAYSGCGAVYFSSTGSVSNCNFVDNKATADYSNSGAIYFVNEGIVSNCNFIGNTASRYGGALYFNSNSNVINCNFTGNTAGVWGGAIWIYSGSVSNCNFTGNTAHSGGAIYIRSGSVENCYFAGNNATDGGAIFMVVSGSVENCNFTNNTASGDGGAVRISSGDVANCNFTNNTASGDGGAVYISSGDVANCNFTNNTADYCGGAVYFSNKGNVTNCNFIGNTAGYGGAVYIYSGDVSNCNFIGNTAECGGAIYGEALVTLSTFRYNNAVNGSAMYNCEYENCIFEGNTDPKVYRDEQLRKNVTINIFAPDIHLGEDIIVNITFSPIITGNVTVGLNGQNRTVEIIDGSGGLIVSSEGFNCGEYMVEVIFDGNEECLSNSNVTTFMIFKSFLSIDVSTDTDEGYIHIILPADIGGSIQFTIGDIVKYLNETGNVDVKSLPAGDYSYEIRYDGDDRYESLSVSNTTRLTKSLPAIDIIVSNIAYGDVEKISIILPDDIEGNASFTFNNDHISINASAQWQYGDLTIGNYNVSIQYSGDSRYYGHSLNKRFTVMPKINLSQIIVIEDYGFVYIDLGNATGSVQFFIDDEYYDGQRIGGGKVNYNLPTNDIPVGNHNMTFKYVGNTFKDDIFTYWDEKSQDYLPISYPITILPKETKTNIESNEMTFLTATILDDNNNIAYDAKGTVTFFVNGVKYAVIDVVDGMAKLDISKFKNGDYLIEWQYSGDAKYNPSSGNSHINVNYRISASALTMIYSSGKSYSVRVYGSNGAISGVSVTFLVNGKVLKTVKTNANGAASVVIKNAPGTYKITTQALGQSSTKTLKVTHVLSLKSVKVKKSAKKLVLTATLKKVNGKYLKSKKITFKFNGKKFTAKTNKKGVAKVTIKAKLLKKLKVGKKVKYQATYLKDTVKKSVKVKK